MDEYEDLLKKENHYVETEELNTTCTTEGNKEVITYSKKFTFHTSQHYL